MAAGRRGETRPAGRSIRRTAGPLALIASVLAVMWPIGSAAPTPSPSVPMPTTPSARTAAVGALFKVINGHLGAHFCTASVVDSPAGNLLITAAHCVTGYSEMSPAGLAFVPAYDGAAPLGTWTVTRIFVGPAWAMSADPDDDVAFLTVVRHGTNKSIQSVTGADRLEVGHPSAGTVRVVGYPDSHIRPLSCQNSISAISLSQMEFDCNGYTDGTSGSPFLIHVNPTTGEGAVIGVIGGYEQGGYSADVSYSAAFGHNVLALYEAATSGG